MQTSKAMNQTIYFLSWAFLLILPVFFVVVNKIPILNDFFFKPCVVFEITGFFCPGCGGTRSVIALFSGHLIKSLLLHPFVLYFAVCFSLFFFSQTFSRLTKGRVKGINYRNIYVYIGIGIILVQWFVKNMILLTTGMNYLTLL